MKWGVPRKKTNETKRFKRRTNKKRDPLMRQSSGYEPGQVVVLGYTMSTGTPIKEYIN